MCSALSKQKMPLCSWREQPDEGKLAAVPDRKTELYNGLFQAYYKSHQKGLGVEGLCASVKSSRPRFGAIIL